MPRDDQRSRQAHGPDYRPLRRTRRPAGDPPDPADAPFAAERLTALSHELGNLLDGSLRCLGLAMRSLDEQGVAQGAATLDAARRRLGTVYSALERMCDLVHLAMTETSIGLPLSAKHPVSLSAAILHAAEVVTPAAEEAGVTILTDAVGLEDVPAGPIYTVVLNAMHNALESMARAGRRGKIEVAARVENVGGARLVRIEVRDEGCGLPRGRSPGRLFDYGVTTKPGGGGVGLALSRELVMELGGTIELAPRGAGRPGAVLRVTYPAPAAAGETPVG